MNRPRSAGLPTRKPYGIAGVPARIVVVVLGLTLMAVSAASAAVYRFDFGSDKSAVQADFTAVTPAAKFPGSPAGWAQAGNSPSATPKPASDWLAAWLTRVIGRVSLRNL